MRSNKKFISKIILALLIECIMVLSFYSNNYAFSTSTKDASVDGCKEFYTVPTSTVITKVPVLMMNQNSTGCVRLTFAVKFYYNDSKITGTNFPRIENLTKSLSIDDYRYVKYGDGFTISTKDYTNLFNITAVQKIIDLANYPIGSNYTVTYIIKSLPNATGFYDHTIPEITCGDGYPLAVGFTVDQVNASDFSHLGSFNSPCAPLPSSLSKVEIAGIGYKVIDINSTLDSLKLPLQQFRSGTTAKEVTCTHDLQLMIKSEDGSPACVTPHIANILIERGWGHLP